MVEGGIPAICIFFLWHALQRLNDDMCVSLCVCGRGRVYEKETRVRNDRGME